MAIARCASIALLAALATPGSPARAQCPSWQSGFQIPGMFGGPMAFATHDDGSGAKLYAGGSMITVGRRPGSNLMRWNGLDWQTFGGDGPNAAVWDLEEFDDGSGPALYAAGQFTLVGGIYARSIARWDGTNWSTVGSGPAGAIFALAVFDDGSGRALYAGGAFSAIGSTLTSGIARWNGASWSALGAGLDGQVTCLQVFDDGGGPALYAGGNFTQAGGAPAQFLARWQGGAWSAVPGAPNLPAQTLCLHDDGGGTALYAGGAFTTAGGSPALRIARYRSGAWSPLGAGFDQGVVTGLASFDDGSGRKLYASGRFLNSGSTSTRRLARWDGVAWSPMGDGADFEAYAFGVYDDGLGGGPALFVGTGSAGPGGSSGISRWTGAQLATLVGGAALFNKSSYLARASITAVFDDGSGAGPELYVGGDFDVAGTLAVEGLALWNGWRWRAFPGPAGTSVGTLGVYDDGGGAGLYGWGTFPSGGSSFQGVARWSAAGWTQLGSAGVTGTNGPHVRALLGMDDGSGPAIYAAGNFYTIGGVSASHVARFRAGAWEFLDFGLNRPGVALAAFDDGTGMALYVGGTFFFAGGAPAQAIARWKNGAWSPLGAGLQQNGSTAGSVTALAVHDDGTGPGLFACGTFSLAGGAPASNIARWRNGAWTSLGSGLPLGAETLAVHDDGSGPALYAGGTMLTGSGTSRNVARWDGATWSSLGSGVAGSVHRLASYGGGLYAAGRTLLWSGGVAASSIALWQASEFRDWNANGVDDACDLANATSADVDLDGVPDECQPAGAETVCAGDGSSSTCPCGDVAAQGRGCPNSSFPRGALLELFGSASVGADSLRLVAGSMPNSTALYFQGTERVMSATGAGSVLGDGLRCAGGNIVRLGTKSNAGNASQYPVGGDPPVSVRGGLPALGGRRVYQVWYRNAAAGFCTSATSNLTNAVGVDWMP